MNPREWIGVMRDRADGAAQRLRDDIQNGIIAGALAVAMSALLTRVRSLWANNVASTVTIGQTFARNDPLLQWQLGMTEKHSRDCLTLNGQVKRASEWRAAGIQPQSPDLECGGWNCDCKLVEVTNG